MGGDGQFTLRHRRRRPTGTSSERCGSSSALSSANGPEIFCPWLASMVGTEFQHRLPQHRASENPIVDSFASSQLPSFARAAGLEKLLELLKASRAGGGERLQIASRPPIHRAEPARRGGSRRKLADQNASTLRRRRRPGLAEVRPANARQRFPQRKVHSAAAEAPTRRLAPAPGRGRRQAGAGGAQATVVTERSSPARSAVNRPARR